MVASGQVKVHSAEGLGRPAQKSYSECQETVLFALSNADAARHRLVQIAHDLENTESAAASEWDKVKCKALFCNIICWTLILAPAYCDEANASPTAQYVHDIQTMDRFKALVEDMRKARPVLRLKIRCYHQTSSDGEDRQYSKEETIDLHNFAAVLDETLSADDMCALVAETHRPIVEHELVLVQVHVNALPVSEDSLKQLRLQAMNWFNQQKSDIYQDYSWSWELDTSGFKTPWPSDGRLALVTGSSRPKWLSQGAWTLSKCLGCAYCYRMKLFANARKIDFHVNKHYQMPGAPAVGPEAVPFAVRNAVPKMAKFLPPAPAPVWCGPSGAQQGAPLQQNSMGAHDPTGREADEVQSFLND